ncbi:MAG: PEP-CTERM sorting domain-containing protein, partial [Xanthomonadales bacterium]|nr:PEP-CTERM sorting domain-containing protein [Xanthomonadales bacterium]NIS44277.1 PEP-CTERM sorting domain-containing protein [Desulfuromonadales bacterium]NIX14106.1 PEP-CTERM sorting domain-containing protein [Xanthomonadales bacterium]
FDDENFSFSQDSGTMLFESTSQLWPGFESFANNLGPDGFDIDIKNFTGSVSEQRSFDFTVDPGDSFYVWARLVTTADNPGVADAFTTLTASFTNVDGLSPAAVPEPGYLAFFSLGLLTLLRRRRLLA